MAEKTDPHAPSRPVQRKYGQQDGLTKREHFALEIYKGLSTGSIDHDTYEDRARRAVLEADRLIMYLND